MCNTVGGDNRDKQVSNLHTSGKQHTQFHNSFTNVIRINIKNCPQDQEC